MAQNLDISDVMPLQQKLESSNQDVPLVHFKDDQPPEHRHLDRGQSVPHQQKDQAHQQRSMSISPSVNQPPGCFAVNCEKYCGGNENVIVLEQKGGIGLWCCCQCNCLFNCLRPIFMTQTTIFLRRLLAVLTFFFPNFFTVQKEKPQLYGSFWIAYTLALLVPITSNLKAYQESPSTFKYDYSMLPISVGLCLTLAMILPLLLYLLLKIMGCQLSLLQVYCVYGYSYLWMMLGVFLCLIPGGIAATVAVVVTFVVNIVFLVVNLWPEFGEATVRKYIGLGVVVLVQAAIGVGFRLTFFSFGEPAVAAQTVPQTALFRHFVLHG